jgi:hypothetical protein
MEDDPAVAEVVGSTGDEVTGVNDDNVVDALDGGAAADTTLSAERKSWPWDRRRRLIPNCWESICGSCRSVRKEDGY